MARITHVKSAQQRYATKPVLNPDGTQKVTPVMRKDGTPKKTKRGKEVVLRVTEADKTKPLPPETCDHCHKPIEVGTPYKHVTPKSGPYGGRKRSRHASCPTWTPSQLTSSNRAIVMAAQEDAERSIDQWTPEDGIDALEEIVHSVGEACTEYAELCRESASNIEDGFGHSTYVSDELNEKADNLESSASELNSWSCDVDTEDAKPWFVTLDGVEQAERYETEEEAEEAAGQLRESELEKDSEFDEGLVAVEEDDVEPDWVEEAREAARVAISEVDY